MITYVDGNFFASPARVLVNTVNTVGVMGKGIAKEFKTIYPDMFKRYQKLCESGNLTIGQLDLYKTPNKWVLNFPTKKHWRSPSKPEYIEAGLKAFVELYANYGIDSIAFPALGCGNGGLNFPEVVKPLMEKYLSNLPITIFTYPHKRNFGLPEYLSQKEMKLWLQSEPRSLAFSQVWDDVIELLEEKKKFKTLNSESKFEAITNNDEGNPGIRIFKPESELIHKSDILDFWQQLRLFGFYVSTSAPAGLERRLSYLMSIFRELPYIGVVKLEAQNKPAAMKGLQYYEPLLKQRSNGRSEQVGENVQLSLW